MVKISFYSTVTCTDRRRVHQFCSGIELKIFKFIVFVEMCVTGWRKHLWSYKLYIFCLSINSRVERATCLSVFLQKYLNPRHYKSLSHKILIQHSRWLQFLKVMYIKTGPTIFVFLYSESLLKATLQLKSYTVSYILPIFSILKFSIFRVFIYSAINYMNHVLVFFYLYRNNPWKFIPKRARKLINLTRFIDLWCLSIFSMLVIYTGTESNDIFMYSLTAKTITELQSSVLDCNIPVSLVDKKIS